MNTEIPQMQEDKKIANLPLSETDQDIIASDEINKLAVLNCNEQLNVLDQVEDKLEILDGTLEFAIENADNKGFYLGLQDNIKAVANLLNKLRN